MTYPPQPAESGDLETSRFRRLAIHALDAIAAYHASLETRPVLPDVTPREMAALFADDLPDEGEEPETILEDWRARVEPNLTAVGSPRHFAYVNGSGSMIGVLADALAAAAATNAGAWNLSPAATEIERQVLRWIARFVGYPEDAGGILVSGGTMANVTALLAALRHASLYDSRAGGLQDRRRSGRFLVYAADHEGHVSVLRAADLLNLGRNAVRPVPSRSDLSMDPAALEALVEDDRADGDIPFAVVAQTGSVNVGAVDSLDEIGDVCARHGLWLHVDGSIGLLGAGVPALAPLYRGLERADSVATDPHKWLGVPPDCGLLLVRRAERLRHAFSIEAPYLGEAGDAPDSALDFRDYGPQLSRGFRALKVWMVLRSLGAAGIRRLVERNVAHARRLHALVSEHPEFEALHDPVLSILAFRYVPPLLAEGAGEPAVEARLDRLNADVAAAVTASGRAFLMTTRIRGRVALRMSIASRRTTEADVDATFEALAQEGRRLARHDDTHAPAPAACETASTR